MDVGSFNGSWATSNKHTNKKSDSSSHSHHELKFSLATEGSSWYLLSSRWKVVGLNFMQAATDAMNSWVQEPCNIQMKTFHSSYTISYIFYSLPKYCLILGDWAVSNVVPEMSTGSHLFLKLWQVFSIFINCWLLEQKLLWLQLGVSQILRYKHKI